MSAPSIGSRITPAASASAATLAARIANSEPILFRPETTPMPKLTEEISSQNWYRSTYTWLRVRSQHHSSTAR